jgi:hypothetical protein
MLTATCGPSCRKRKSKKTVEKIKESVQRIQDDSGGAATYTNSLIIRDEVPSEAVLDASGQSVVDPKAMTEAERKFQEKHRRRVSCLRGT